jgi:hypothetical protein
MARKILSRAEALKQGLKTFFTGKPCPRGHIAEIYVNGKCVECNRERNKLRPKTGKTGKTTKSKPAPATAGADDALLTKINEAVAEVNKAENVVVSAQAELVLKSKLVGALLLEAKKRHPKVAEFEAFLKRVDGLKLSRAYDLMRLAGGRVTDAELREDARERQQKSRAKRKLPPSPPLLPEPEPASDAKSPHSVTEPHVTEKSDEMNYDAEAAIASARALREFTVACKAWLPMMIDIDQEHARSLVLEMTKAETKAA